MPHALARRTFLLPALVLLLSSGTLGALTGSTADEPDYIALKTQAGSVRGAVLDQETRLRVYRGIPYAAPPVGERRWLAPSPAEKWEGIRDALEFAAACPQLPLLAMITGEPLPETDEDCLYLNVWTNAAIGESRPVMVWIHGGGLSLGWGHQKAYDGVEFAKRGVVLVSINYRLGPLGFLSHPQLSESTTSGASGNYGFLDQMAALIWVKSNIAQFGGDPENVTIFGESAGGTSVHALVASPLAKGFFQRAIAQSPWVTESNVRSLQEPYSVHLGAHDYGKQWAQLMLDDEEVSVAKLRAVAADELIRKTGPAGFEPHITTGGSFMPQHSEAMFAAAQHNRVPLIVGTNRDEGTMFMQMQPLADRDAFLAALEAVHGEKAAQVAALYPSNSPEQLLEQHNRYLTDTLFLRGSRAMLRAQASASAPAFQYYFTRVNPMNPAWGAHHAAELGYVFGTNEGDAYTETDSKLADLMMDYWIAFATSGNPNGGGRPSWPAFDVEQQRFLEFGDEVKPGQYLGREINDRLEEIRRAADEPADD